MSKKEKLIGRLKTIPSDFTWDEFNILLTGLGFEVIKTGKSGGSRRKFTNGSIIINLHEHHPKNILKKYAVKQVLNTLEN